MTWLREHLVAVRDAMIALVAVALGILFSASLGRLVRQMEEIASCRNVHVHIHVDQHTGAADRPPPQRDQERGPEPIQPGGEEFDASRYEALVQLWIHHNTMRLQWPLGSFAVIVAFLAIVATALNKDISDPANWGVDSSVRRLGGGSILLSSIVVFLIAVAVRRYETFLNSVATEIGEIEKKYQVGEVRDNNSRATWINFKAMNHPEGRTGRNHIFYSLLVAGPILLGFGAVIICGT
jgi:hypothetical protein